ncbi:MAG: family 20 glycosylhydrolase [Bacteroidota bacterium]
MLILLGGILLLGGGGAIGLYLFLQKPPAPISESDREALEIMPLPAKLLFGEDTIRLGNALNLLDAPQHPQAVRALNRFVDWLEKNGQAGPKLPLDIRIDSLAPSVPQPNMDESYQVSVDEEGLKIVAANQYGMMYALESLRQLVDEDEKGLYLRELRMEDQPRYSWRGLMLDASRHFLPVSTIRKTIDGMALVKANVLHLHLTDDQGFRIESKLFPQLHEAGSDGMYYRQEEMAELVAYAADRGIRVIPEIDMPGHVSSWLVGHPELASQPGPYEVSHRFGIHEAALDPSREAVYVFLDQLIGEMAELFPDPYFHIGGDEVNPAHWQQTEGIQMFKRSNGLGDEKDLQAYFNRRLVKLVEQHGKILMGWDEILHPDLHEGVPIQVWRNHLTLLEAAEKGHPAILSNGFYLDHKLSAGHHYGIDPEVVPGGVNIEPDSIWENYAIDLQVRENQMKGNLTVFGAPDHLRGVMDISGNLISVEKMEREGESLDFSFESGFGNAELHAKLIGDSLQGEVSLAMISLQISGRKIGGHDIPGTVAPELKKVPELTDSLQQMIIGGEACMWSEVIDSVNVHSRVWPRMAAIAEKFWSPKDMTTDESDMYRRLAVLENQLQDRGLNSEAGLMRKRTLIFGADVSPAVHTFLDLLEECKYYERLRFLPASFNTLQPMEAVVDAVGPESRTARQFQHWVDGYLADSVHLLYKGEIENQLAIWRDNHQALRPAFQSSPAMTDVSMLSYALAEMSDVALQAMMYRASGQTWSEEENDDIDLIAGQLNAHIAGVELAVAKDLLRLVRLE